MHFSIGLVVTFLQDPASSPWQLGVNLQRRQWAPAHIYNVRPERQNYLLPLAHQTKVSKKRARAGANLLFILQFWSFCTFMADSEKKFEKWKKSNICLGGPYLLSLLDSDPD